MNQSSVEDTQSQINWQLIERESRWWWIEMNLRQEIWVELNFWKVLSACGHFRQTQIKFHKKFLDIEPQMPGSKELEIPMDAFVELAGTANISISKMIERNCGLDQSLIIFSRRTAVLGPQFLPDFMALVVIALIEFLNPGEIEQFVLFRFTHDFHSSFLAEVVRGVFPSLEYNRAYVFFTQRTSTRMLKNVSQS